MSFISLRLYQNLISSMWEPNILFFKRILTRVRFSNKKTQHRYEKPSFELLDMVVQEAFQTCRPLLFLVTSKRWMIILYCWRLRALQTQGLDTPACELTGKPSPWGLALWYQKEAYKGGKQQTSYPDMMPVNHIHNQHGKTALRVQ